MNEYDLAEAILIDSLGGVTGTSKTNYHNLSVSAIKRELLAWHDVKRKNGETVNFDTVIGRCSLAGWLSSIAGTDDEVVIAYSLKIIKSQLTEGLHYLATEIYGEYRS